MDELTFQNLFLILWGTGMGTLARILTLRVDTRQYPSFPTGTFINIVMGFVAAALGAVAIPALLAKDFVAVTFLTIAIQEFRDTRQMERDSLEKLEQSEFTKRGEAYIDGISKTYEARNYISLVTSFFTVLIARIFYTDHWAVNSLIAAATGLIVIYCLQRFTKGKRVEDICAVTEGKITVDRSELYVDGVFVTNLLGTDRSRELFRQEGIAFVLKPTSERYRVTLDNRGQQQAILFEAVRTFGLKRYQFVRGDYKKGTTILAFVPIVRDPEAILGVIKSTPILENSRKLEKNMTPRR